MVEWCWWDERWSDVGGGGGAGGRLPFETNMEEEVMAMRNRMKRLQKRVRAAVPAMRSLTVFYMDATDDFPIGSGREVWDGKGLEVAVRPGSNIEDEEWPLIPGGPHKLIRGASWMMDV